MPLPELHAASRNCSWFCLGAAYRRVVVNLPDKSGREAILKVHTRKVPKEILEVTGLPPAPRHHRWAYIARWSTSPTSISQKNASELGRAGQLRRVSYCRLPE
jgi:SpoVK/Ycf46/Vps4 family AAA+-type ATPase